VCKSFLDFILCNTVPGGGRWRKVRGRGEEGAGENEL